MKETEKRNKELIEEVEKLKRQVKTLKDRKKYGLVWEEEKEPEQIVLDCQYKIPLLKEVKLKEIISDKEKPVNVLIEGDNYHALSVLNYTHKGKVDIIYIDPPFNTGNKSWKYNNNFVEKDDNFKHSKWISFMNHRLKLAKHLLKNTGIILVAIDDYEHHTLRLLMDEIFGENNRLGTIVVVHNPGGRSDDQFIATSHEYMLVYGKNKECSKINLMPLNEKQLEEYKMTDEISPYKLQSFMRTGSNSRPEDRPNLHYSLYYNEKEDELSTKKENKDFIEILPIDRKGNKRVWRWGKETVDKKKDTEFKVTNYKGKFVVKVKKRFFGNGLSGSKPKTFWFDPKYNASTYGTILLQNILQKEKPFDYPKSLYTVKDAMIISTNKNAIILDFFAGSGTTGHAVLELNKEDGGNRKFILCTNNEDNNSDGSKICSDICYPRIEKAIKGYKTSKGESINSLGGNLKYFKTELLDIEHISHISDEQKIKLTYQAGEMIALRESAFKEVEKDEWWQIFRDGTKYTAIYFKENKKKLNDLVKKLSKLKEKVVLYIFSWGKDEYKNEFTEYKNIKVEDIPEPIIDVYKEVNRLS